VIGDRRAFLPLLAAYIAAVQSAYVMPVLLGAASDSLGLRADAAGLLTTLELLGYAVGGLVLAPRLDRLPRARIAHFAGAALALAHLASAAVDEFTVLAVMRSCAGLAAGSLMAITNAEIARSGDAERKYARCIAAAIAFGCIGLAVIPLLARSYGHLGAYGYAGVVVLGLLPLTWRWPAPVAIDRGGAMNFAALLPLCGFTLLLCFSDGVVYPFAERMGVGLGLEPVLNLLLAGALATGCLGAMAASRIGTRWGHIRPLVVAGWLTALAGLTIPYAMGPVSFLLATGTKNLTLFFLFPYLLGAAAVRDPSGRGVAAVTGCIPLGISIGPWVGGILVEATGYRVLGWVGIAAIALATPMVLSVRRT